ncbi:MBG domain-containing protein [Mangrovibacterium diazotrophicum]|uniref:Putative secreted protein (Por secretion system target) n=1 Tax=Mangrovibacterium diazotrophicum TaxID=1261403 RepID=A0A419W9H2_9BACT|nr:MBG domain-containing protein [Mangrovibacterium diazotrophicum]RKD92121.1 putative secreted protein (Por secretion system target) [Mangrovibacterium diazotrophicum]
MKRLTSICLSLLLTLLANLTHAQFSGDFAPSNWALYSVSSYSDAYVNTSGAPTTIVFGGNDSDYGDYMSGNLYDEYWITIPSSYSDGSISFDWSFVNPDIEAFYYVVNSTETHVASYNDSGSLTIPVSPGDVFAFRIYSYDDCCGRGVLTISNFNSNAVVNSSPSFNAGSSTDLSLALNASATAINDSLAVTDTDSGDALSWTVTTAPSHGSLGGFPASATSTGSAVTPTGLTYTPTTDYSGSDSFVIQISDGTETASITVNVTIKATQAITFNAIDSKTYGDADFSLGNATTDKGLTVTYAAADPTVVSISGNTATILKAGTTQITATQAGDATYAAADTVKQTLVVNKKELTVTSAVAADKTYDGSTTATISGASLSGIVDTDVVTLGNSTSGTFAQATVGSGIAVGTSMTISGDDAANYSLTQPSLTAAITTKELTVTGAKASDKVYDGSTTATISGASLSGVVGTDAVTLANSTTGTFNQAAVGSSIVVTTTMTLSGDDAANYTLTQPSLSAVITTKSITVTADADQSKVYGESDPTFTYSVSPALVSGDNFSGGLTRAAGEDVDTYAIAQGTLTAGSNYDLTFVADNFAITQKAITVTADADQSKVYGEIDPTLTYSVAPALVTGDSFSGALTRAAGEDVDSYAIAQGTLTAGSNYDLTFVADNFSITQKAITVTANADQSKVYGETDPTFTYSVSPALVSGDSFSGALTRAAGEDVATYAIAQGTLTAGSNYVLTFVADNFAITQKAITVTADADQSKVYGESDPTLTYSVSPALVSGDSFSGALTRAAGEDVDTYAIAQGTLTAGSNYDLTFVADNFSITQKAITVTADADQSKVYGETDPTFTYSVSPALVSGDSFSGALTRAAGEDVDSYAIAQGTLTAGSNYDLTFVADNFAITQKPITVTADADQSKVYGETDPTFTYSVSPALVSGDSFTGALTRAAGEDVDSYAIAQGTLTAGSNYDLTFVADNFSITQKAITVTANADQSKVYGESDPTLTYSVSPALVTGDSFSGALTRAAGEDVDSYAIAQGTLTAGSNYDLTFVADNFSITQKPITVTADADQSKVYGETDPTFTYSVSPDLVSGDSFSGSLTRAAGEDVNTYAIAQGTLTAGTNYDLTFVADNFSITQKAITVTADASQSKVYGETDPTFTYSVSPDLVSGDSFTGELTREAGEDAGSYAIEIGTLTAGSNYDLSFVSADFVIEKAAQTISFDAIPVKHLETDDDFQLNATASSGLAVTYSYTYSADQTPAEVSEEGFVYLLTSGEVEITAMQAGDNNYLPAENVSQTLTIESSDASIHQLTIDGETYEQPEQEIYYQIDCGEEEISVTISYITEPNASSSEGSTFVIDTPVPGIYRQSITITSQDGTTQQTYLIVVEKAFNFDDIVVQKYNNVLLVNNNPDNNGGYTFVAYKWYKNGVLIGTGQYYSAGQNASNQLDPTASYSVELTTSEGEVIHTCDFSIELNSAFALTVTPNPVQAGSTVQVVTNYDDDMLSDRTIHVTNLYGTSVMQQVSASNNTSLTLPNSLAPGTYVVTTVASGVSLNAKIIVQ